MKNLFFCELTISKRFLLHVKKAMHFQIILYKSLKVMSKERSTYLLIIVACSSTPETCDSFLL